MKAIVGCLCDPILHVMIIAVVIAILAVQSRQGETTEKAGWAGAPRSAADCLLYGDDRPTSALASFRN